MSLPDLSAPVVVLLSAVGEGRRESVCENRRVSSSLGLSSLGDDSHEHGLKHQEQRGSRLTWLIIETQLAYWQIAL